MDDKSEWTMGVKPPFSCQERTEGGQFSCGVMTMLNEVLFQLLF